MNKLIIRLITLLVLTSCKGESQSKIWQLDSSSDLEGITYRSDDKQSMARILSVKDIEKLAYRKIEANGRNSFAQQLDFALSVLSIDVDTMKTDTGNTIPILYGNGYSADGEVKFVITFKDEKTKTVVLLVSNHKEFDTKKELAVLKENNFDFFQYKTQISYIETSKTNESKKTNEPEKKYPIPHGVKYKAGKVYWNGWNYKDDLHATAGEASDPEAPKFAMEVIKVTDVKNKKAAIDKALKMNNIKSASYDSLERMDISKQMVGNHMFFTVGKSKLAGKEAVLFLRIERVKNKPNYFVLMMEIPKKTYKEWGGIASILLATQVISSVNSIPSEPQKQIVNATPLQQMKIYELHITPL